MREFHHIISWLGYHVMWMPNASLLKAQHGFRVGLRTFWIVRKLGPLTIAKQF